MIVKFEKHAHDFSVAVGIMKTCFLFLVIAFALSVSAQTVEIPDPGLQQAIRIALDKPEGDITVEDIESLTVLDASRGTRSSDAPLIHNLSGIEAAVNITRLNLKGLPFPPLKNIGKVDFSCLQSLKPLTTLVLVNNQLTSLTVPAGFDLTNLHLIGFDKSIVTFYIPLTVKLVSDKVEVNWTQGMLQ